MVSSLAIERKPEASGMQIFGDYVEQGDGEEYLIIHFSPTSIPLRKRWRNTGLSADFLTEYWATFFPENDVSPEKHSEIKESIRYVANELLENLMKFSYGPANYPVGLALYLYKDEFRFYASNPIDSQAVGPFQARIQGLLTEDIDALYMRQLKQNVTETGRTESNLGLLTIAHDYRARLAWRFETIEHDGAEITLVTTLVQLKI